MSLDLSHDFSVMSATNSENTLPVSGGTPAHTTKRFIFVSAPGVPLMTCALSSRSAIELAISRAETTMRLLGWQHERDRGTQRARLQRK